MKVDNDQNDAEPTMAVEDPVTISNIVGPETHSHEKDDNEVTKELKPLGKTKRARSFSSTQNENMEPPRDTISAEASEPVGVAEGNPNKHQLEEVVQEGSRKRLKALIHILIKQRIRELENEEEETAFIAAGGKIEITIPKTYSVAINDLYHGPEWSEAIQEEIRSLEANGTWKEELAPKGTNLVSTKWVFTIKTHSDGTLERYKARLVARGFSQVYGENYTDTFAPTVRMDTLRVFLAITAAKNLTCRQYDIKNAFTESILREKIFLSAPKGVPVKSGHALCLMRSLYGLKQSARDWNLLCKDHLIALGFEQSLADPCLFTHERRGITLSVYVDDMAASCNDSNNLDWFFASMKKLFNIKDMAEISKILGMRVTRNRATRELFLDQEEYLTKVIKRLGSRSTNNMARSFTKSN